MAFPGKFLTLSIKKQIISTVIFFSFVTVMLILIILSLSIYELKEDALNNYIDYYYTIQKDILQNVISFQNYFIFNYEDMLKILICQLAILVDISEYIYLNDTLYSFKNLDYSNFSSDFNGTDSNLTFYYFNNKNSNINDDKIEEFLKLTFQIASVFKSFRFPYYGESEIFEEIIIYLNKTKRLYSPHNSYLYNFIKNEIGSDNINGYYINLRDNISNLVNISLQKLIVDNSIYRELTLTEEMIDLLKNYKINKDIKIFAKYSPYLDYKNQFLHLMKIEDEGNEFYFTMKLKKELMDEISLKIMGFFNVSSILINPEDDTVLNFMSCGIMGIKSNLGKLSKNSKNNIEEFFNTINKNSLNRNMAIDKCLDINNKDKNFVNYIKQKTSFFDGFNISFIELSNDVVNKDYMVSRYIYPDYFILERKRPRYLILNFLNAYSFMNFYIPRSYVDDKSNYLLLSFYSITLANWHIWIIIFFIIFILCLKISNEITEPLIKLKKGIEQMSFNDEKIFEYKDDDNINELFAMCKELVNKDEFKKSLKDNAFKNENNLLLESDDKNYLSSLDTGENISVIRRGINRNLILNNQLFEKNRKSLNQENKVSFDKEIVVYKDFKFLLKSRPRNQSRKRPKTINKLINKNFDLMPIKNYNKFKTKGDYNINSKIRDNFLRESMVSNQTKKDNKLSYDTKLVKEKANKNDNELNILLYELLFILGRNLFKPLDKDNKKLKSNKFLKSDRSLISNNDINSGYDSSKNIKYEDNNKFYNYTDSLYENNDSSIIYEEIKSTSDVNKENGENILKEEYIINFKKNNLYYKYLNAKKDWNNKFLKRRNAHDLEMDSNAMVELDDEEYNTSLLPRKNIKLSEFYKSTTSFKSNGSKNISGKSLRMSNLKKSIIKNKNNKSDKPKVTLRKSITMPIKLFGTQITNPKQRKLGMRASVSANVKNLKVSLTKKTKFNINSNIDNK